MEDEIWVLAPGFPSYDVSSHGRVRRRTSVTSGKAGHILNGSVTHSGYLNVRLSQDGRMYNVRPNRLACEAFHGPAPTKLHHAAHKDSDRRNNRCDNLYWADKFQNEADKDAIGGRPVGSQHLLAKLDERKVQEMRARWRAGETYARMAVDYGVSAGSLWSILTGKSWRHVK